MFSIPQVVFNFSPSTVFPKPTNLTEAPQLSDTVNVTEGTRSGAVAAPWFIYVTVFWMAADNPKSVFVFVKFCANKIYQEARRHG